MRPILLLLCILFLKCHPANKNTNESEEEVVVVDTLTSKVNVEISYEMLAELLSTDEPIPKEFFGNDSIDYVNEYHENSFQNITENENYLIGILKIARREILWNPSYYLCSFSKANGLLSSSLYLGYSSEVGESIATVEQYGDDPSEFLVIKKEYEWIEVGDSFQRGMLIDSVAMFYNLDSMGKFKSEIDQELTKQTKLFAQSVESNVSGEISYYKKDLLVITFMISSEESLYFKTKIMRKNGDQWKEIGDDVSGLFLAIKDFDGDGKEELLLDDYYSYSANEGEYVMYSISDENLIGLGKYGAYGFMEHEHSSSIEIKRDSILEIIQSNGTAHDGSFIYVYDTTSYSLSDFLGLFILDLEGFLTWTESNLSDFSNEEMVPQPLPYNCSSYLETEGYSPIGIIRRSEENDLDLVLFRKISDYGKSEFNYLLGAYQYDRLYNEEIFLQGESLSCPQPVVTIKSELDKRFIEIVKEACSGDEGEPGTEFDYPGSIELIEISKTGKTQFRG